MYSLPDDAAYIDATRISRWTCDLAHTSAVPLWSSVSTIGRGSLKVFG
jgi:hypothetical protein